MAAGMAVCGWYLVRHEQGQQEGQQSGVWAGSIENHGGLALIIGGLAVMLVAQITLWRSYSSTLVIREDHQLITHGIYRFVRHPIYLGGLTAVIFGIPVFTSSLYGFLVLIVLIPVILNRIGMEERLLIEEFGDEYRSFQKTARKLIPFIY